MTSSIASKSKTLDSLRIFASDIKLSHSVFALPFAACGLLFSISEVPSFLQIVALIICMVSARSFAMGMNRLIDRKIDAGNPRTRSRSIPSGELSVFHAALWTAGSGFIFWLTCKALDPKAATFSMPMLFILMSYSYMKRVSWLTHWYLGACLGFAPIAVSIALNGDASMPVVLIGFGVAFWTAGFDILYSTQDHLFDRNQNLKSVPVKFGVRKSIKISQICFLTMISCLIISGFLYGSGSIYYIGVVFVAILLIYEHWLIRDLTASKGSKNINTAFFTINGWVSVAFYVFAQIDWIYL